MEKINKIFFINLEKCSGRREHFIKQCQIHMIPFDKIQKVEAVDGMNYNFSRVELDLFKRSNFILNPKPIVCRIMGNQLSHYYTLKNIIQNKYKYSIICQDDVMFKSGFVSYIDKIIENLPQNAEMINLGLHKHAEGKDFVPWDFTPIRIEHLVDTNLTNDSDIICSEIINPYVGVWKEDMNPCSLCYIVTLEGAQNIVNYFDMFGFKKTTDFNFIDYLVNKKIFYGSKDVLATTNIEFPSEIFR